MLEAARKAGAAGQLLSPKELQAAAAEALRPKEVRARSRVCARRRCCAKGGLRCCAKGGRS